MVTALRRPTEISAQTTALTTPTNDPTMNRPGSKANEKGNRNAESATRQVNQPAFIQGASAIDAATNTVLQTGGEIVLKTA